MSLSLSLFRGMGGADRIPDGQSSTGVFVNLNKTKEDISRMLTVLVLDDLDLVSMSSVGSHLIVQNTLGAGTGRGQPSSLNSSCSVILPLYCVFTVY